MPFVSMCTYGHGMEGNTLLPGSLSELLATHPEVVEVAPGAAGRHWHATVLLADGGCGYVHADDEYGLLAKLAAEVC